MVALKRDGPPAWSLGARCFIPGGSALGLLSKGGSMVISLGVLRGLLSAQPTPASREGSTAEPSVPQRGRIPGAASPPAHLIRHTCCCPRRFNVESSPGPGAHERGAFRAESAARGSGEYLGFATRGWGYVISYGRVRCSNGPPGGAWAGADRAEWARPFIVIGTWPSRAAWERGRLLLLEGPAVEIVPPQTPFNRPAKPTQREEPACVLSPVAVARASSCSAACSPPPRAPAGPPRPPGGEGHRRAIGPGVGLDGLPPERPASAKVQRGFLRGGKDSTFEILGHQGRAGFPGAALPRLIGGLGGTFSAKRPSNHAHQSPRLQEEGNLVARSTRHVRLGP